MTLKSFPLAIPFLLVCFSTLGQGTFVYDQQSSDEGYVQSENAIGFGQQPIGQSFTPSLNSVGFIRIALSYGVGSGSFHINLRSDSITGTILGTTTSVTWTGPGFVDFLFDNPIPVTAGTTYYFQPVIESGNGWAVNAGTYSYSGGTAFAYGTVTPNFDFWFREGIVVPEPSPFLISIGGILLLSIKRLFRS